MVANKPSLTSASSKRLCKLQERVVRAHKTLGAVLSALVMAALVPAMAFAQSQPVLEEVIITSQKK